MSDLRVTKEGVPIYDGTAEQYIPYRRAALNYVETLEWKKRSLAGPRLLAALEGTARVAVQDQMPGWISHDMGAQQLLDYLKSKMQPPTLAEAGKMITRFFYSIKRRRGESMNHWILRHDEALFEARRTLAEAIQEYGVLGPSTTRSQVSASASRGPWESQSQHGAVSHRSSRPAEEGGPFDGNGLLREDEDDPGDSASAAPAQSEWHGHTGWWNWSSSDHGWDAWSWRDWSRPQQPHQTTSSQGKYDVSISASVEADKFLPDFVVAWMLLQRSGLDGTERGAIIANLKNQFTTTRVKEALRLAWPEEDLKKRDMARGSALLVEDDDEDIMMNDMETDDQNDMTKEEEEEFGYLVKETEEAYQTYQVARRTLREAREKQSLFKKNRQFFPMRRDSGFKGKGDSKGSGVKCFRCNGNHPTAECPDKHAPKPGTQTAHLAFPVYGIDEPYATDVLLHELQEQAEQSAFSLQQILREGKAIIDGGATSSVASVEAMEQIMKLNKVQGGNREITVEQSERPQFRFGNNGRTQCLSTAKVPVPLGQQLGEMKVHVHEIEGQPVLLSVSALRALGAVIDFERDEAIFKNVDAKVVVPLERAPSGHQLFPLTQDILSSGRTRLSAFSSLHQSCTE